MLKLHIDNRETKIIDIIKNYDNLEFDFSIEQLDIGDFHILINDEKIIHVYERKTLKDLLSSIKDGRYSEQKSRLLELRDKGIKIFYIIEEFDNFTKITDQSLLGSIISLTIANDIPCLFTNNYTETFNIIIEIMKRIKKDVNKFIINSDENNISNIHITKKKSDNITKENIIVIMLSQIPNISEKIANIIAYYHPSISSLIKKLDEYDTDRERIKYLSKLKLENMKRSVGEKTAEKIINFLY